MISTSRAFFAASLLFVLAGIGTSAEAPGGGGNASSYTDGTYGYSISPPNFGVAANGTVLPAVFSGQGVGGFASNVNVMISTGKTTRKDYLALSLGQLEQAKAKINKQEERQVSGRDAEWMDFEMAQGGRQLRFLSLAVVGDDRLYLITCTSPVDVFPQHEAEFKKTLDSFKLTGK